MLKTLLRCGVTLCIALLFSVHFLWAAEDDEKEGGIKKHGVIQNIAEDRQIIRVGGSYEPEGLDKYMKRQIDGLVTKIGDLDSKMTQLQAVLEEQTKEIIEIQKNIFLIRKKITLDIE